MAVSHYKNNEIHFLSMEILYISSSPFFFYLGGINILPPPLSFSTIGGTAKVPCLATTVYLSHNRT